MDLSWQRTRFLNRCLVPRLHFTSLFLVLFFFESSALASFSENATIRLWNSCVAWAETTPGTHDDWCVGEVGRHVEVSWRHTGQDVADCLEGFGKGICENTTLHTHEELPRERLRRSRKRLVELNETLMDYLLYRRQTKLLILLNVYLNGSVEVVETGVNLAALLDECVVSKHLNYFAYEHSPDVWIPFLLRNHETTRLLRWTGRSERHYNFTYLAAFPHVFAICQATEAFERLDFAQNHLKQAIDAILPTQQWIQSMGKNVFVPATHPIAPLSPLVISGHVSFLCVDYDGNAQFPKDVVIPYLADVRNNPWPVRGIDKRNRLLMFCSAPTQFVRREIIRIYSNISADVFISGSHVKEEQYGELLSTTVFCFMARGDTVSSARLFSLIDAGCIPVIVSDWIYLPFQRLIDYSKFVIFAEESQVLGDPTAFLNVLRSISASKIQEMQEFLVQAQFLTLWDSSYVLNPVSLIFIEALIVRSCYQEGMANTTHVARRIRLWGFCRNSLLGITPER